MSEYRLDVTLKEAQVCFNNKNPEEMAGNAGGSYDAKKNIIKINFLTKTYNICYPQNDTVSLGENPNLRLSILLLHYLTRASGMNISQEMISFKEIPGGQIYIGPFRNRTISPILHNFGTNPDAFIESGIKLGGEQSSHGDASLIMPVLPKVRLEYILWQGDEEFPPSATILFPSNVQHYLETEDCVQLAQLVSSALCL